MSKLQTLFFLSIISISFSTLLKTKTSCVALGGDCDLTSYCCGKLQCKDYRCSLKGTKDNQLGWDKSKKEGNKCDWFHHCPKYYHCESHYCVVSRNKVVNAVAKTLKRDY